MTPTEREAARGRRRRREDPWAHREAERRWYVKNREATLAKKRAYKNANHSKLMEYQRAYRAARPNCTRDWQRNRRMQRAWLAWTRVLATHRSST